MKTFRFLGALALCAALIPSLASCGDDDDDDDNPGTGGGNLTEVEGLRLSSAGGYNFTYDAKGRLTRVASQYGGGVEIDYAKGVMSDLNADDEASEYKIRFNKSGYLSEASGSWDYIDNDGGDSYRVKGSGKMTFSYNGAGNLTAISVSMSETEKDLEDGTTEKFAETYTIKYVWKNGDMVSATERGSENEDGDKYNWATDYEVDYGSMENKFYQTTFALSYIGLEESEWQALAVAGLVGKGTATLPSSMTETEDDNVYSESYSFSLNDNGTIASERSNNYSAYFYSYAEARSAMTVADEPAKPFKLHNLFGRKHARK